ncbi:MAG: hypothetical protein HY517_00095 [Candidatus Aenigmarchaeota archaeon]|nr:hypothetical protein [Candidatus Aenigmarchaeota archaeon]
MSEQTLREYVWSRTERLLPNARKEVRDAIREGICEYAEWLSQPSHRRVEQPDLSTGYQDRARRLYSQFLDEKQEHDIGIHRHAGGELSGNPVAYELGMRTTTKP